MAPPTCYANGERAQGAAGFPPVAWRPCCDGRAQQVEAPALGWGKFCVAPPASGGAGWTALVARGSPRPRHEATFVMAGNGKAYLIGGRGLKNMSVYDVASNSWSDGPATPLEMHHMQAVHLGGYIYLPSAFTGPYPYETVVPTFYAFHVATSRWETRAPLAAARRRGSAAVVARGGKIYVAMGNVGGHGEHATTLGRLDEYDPATNKWRSLPDAPHPRDHTGAGVTRDMMCVAGGRDGGVANFFNAPVAQTNCYNFTSASWTVLPSIPTPRAGSSYGTTCEGALVVAGGEGGGQAYSRVDKFDGLRWGTPTYMTAARHGSGVAVGGCGCGSLYVASGAGTQGGSMELSSAELFSSGGARC